MKSIIAKEVLSKFGPLRNASQTSFKICFIVVWCDSSCMYVQQKTKAMGSKVQNVFSKFGKPILEQGMGVRMIFLFHILHHPNGIRAGLTVGKRK
jgi:hypothetical protein